MGKNVGVTLDDATYEQVKAYAERRGLATTGNGYGVATVIRMALKAYLSKYDKGQVDDD